MPLKAPEIRVEIFCASGRIAQVNLIPSLEVFSCSIENGTFTLEKKIFAWLSSYAAGNPLPLPYSLFEAANLSLFQQAVLKQLRGISFGETISYQKLAERCKKPRGQRAIGRACHRNPFPLFFPCHRVLASDGSIGGFAYDLEIKKQLVRFESLQRQLKE